MIIDKPTGNEESGIAAPYPLQALSAITPTCVWILSLELLLCQIYFILCCFNKPIGVHVLNSITGRSVIVVFLLLKAFNSFFNRLWAGVDRKKAKNSSLSVYAIGM